LELPSRSAATTGATICGAEVAVFMIPKSRPYALASGRTSALSAWSTDR